MCCVQVDNGPGKKQTQNTYNIRKLYFLLFILLVVSCTTKNNPEMTQTDKNIKLINQYFTAFNNHEWSKMASMYTEKAEFKDPSLGQGIVTQTREQVIKKYSELNQVFSDINDEVIQLYPSGDKHVIVEFISRGTAPDDSKFELPICTIFTIEDGQITKDFTYYDNFQE